jgi:hypothetical protein
LELRFILHQKTPAIANNKPKAARIEKDHSSIPKDEACWVKRMSPTFLNLSSKSFSGVRKVGSPYLSKKTAEFPEAIATE